MCAALVLALPATVQAQEQVRCSPFSWTTLGTAGGPVPTVERGEPANLLRAGGLRILVDVGDGTVNQMARVGSDLGQIQAVVISHHHLDHYGGLLAVLGLRWMNNFPGVLTIYGPPGTTELVDGLLASLGPQARVGFGIAPTVPPADTVRVIEIGDGGQIDIGALHISARANSHFSGARGYQPGEAVPLSFRFEFEGRSITYTGDTGPSDAVTQLADGSDMLVSEVMDFDRLIAMMRVARPDMSPALFALMTEHIATHHISGEQVGAIAGLARVGQVVLTHFAIPASLAQSEDDIRAGVRAGYSGPVHFGRDLASFDVGCLQADRFDD